MVDNSSSIYSFTSRDNVPKINYKYNVEEQSNVDNKYSKNIKNLISCEKPDICEKYKTEIEKLKETIKNLNVINNK